MNAIFNSIILLLSKVVPLRKMVVFRSFNGHYSDSPKALSEELHRMFPEIQLIWLLDKSSISEAPDYVKKIDINSWSATFYLNTAAIFIDNNYGRKGIILTGHNKTSIIPRILVWLNKRNGQVNLSTWHGTPLKKIGNDQPQSEGVDLLTPPLIMTHPNQHTKDVLNRITFNRATHYVLGLPRNDVLFSNTARNEIKKRIGIRQDTRVVLFAPTFRSDGYDTNNRNIARSGLDQIDQMKIDTLLAKLSDKFGGEKWVFVCRFHYFVEKEINWGELENKYPEMIINGNLHDDMSEYLAITDVLITDCSSSAFDFAFTGRPIFLFFPDVDHYKGVERGLYFDMGDLPFPWSESFEELLITIDGFDKNRFDNGIRSMNKKLVTVDDGEASKRIIKLVLEKSKCLNYRLSEL